MNRERMTKEEIKNLSIKAMEHVRSVDYRVSLRWVFYRLLQDGIYSKKGDYKRFEQQASKWRHEGIGKWKPNTLEDSTREKIYRGIGRSTPIEEIPKSIIYNLNLWTKDSHFKYQDFYIECWFEARAMLGQFEKYASNISLVPFGGYTSIDMKFRLAKDIESMASRFDKPIVILYFGDCDRHGKQIAASSITGHKGLAKWCNISFELIWCGLTPDQAIQYKIPENPDKPGEYQWEALPDYAAQEIIESNIKKYINHEAIDRVKRESEELNEILKGKIYKAFET